jgi:hypothetical protein
VIDNISEISSSTMSNFLEKSMSDTLPCDLDSNVTFPLNNGDFNWMMTEMNYNNSQNLSNMMFMEFDILNSEVSREHLKSLQEINNDFVEKEIHFVFNVFPSKFRLLCMAILYSNRTYTSLQKPENLSKVFNKGWSLTKMNLLKKRKTFRNLIQISK